MSTHAPPQSVPLLHRQLPPEQYCPEGHARPQVPQFALSEFVSTHALPQSVPLLHRQLPLEQYCPEGHARPQPPQFALSPCVFTQAPEQSISPPGQLVMTHEPD